MAATAATPAAAANDSPALLPADLPAICQPPHRQYIPVTMRGAALALAAPSPAAPDGALPTTFHAIRVGYADLAASRGQVTATQASLTQASANLVALSAGRPDWSYFFWDGHPEWWSSEVRDDAFDYLAADIAAYGPGRGVNAIVDMLAPRWIISHTADAALARWGALSTEQVSTSALVNGAFGRHALEMIGYLAARYAVDSVSVTELFYDDYGYGADDLALYRADTGQPDWPRDGDGNINPADVGLGMWRSQKVASWLQRAAACARNHGKQLFFDARISWGNLSAESRENGQHYGTLLPVVDRILLWGYASLNGYAPSYLQTVATYLGAKYPAGRFIMSVGMWGPGGSTISATDMRASMQSSAGGGIHDLWITPSNMMTATHWNALQPGWP